VRGLIKKYIYMYSKKGWGVVQVVDLLPRKYKAIISNPSTAKKKKKGHSFEQIIH
jgi:hypothetical protein